MVSFPRHGEVEVGRVEVGRVGAGAGREIERRREENSIREMKRERFYRFDLSLTYVSH